LGLNGAGTIFSIISGSAVKLISTRRSMIPFMAGIFMIGALEMIQGVNLGDKSAIVNNGEELSN
jgi:hypothetical protein